MSRLSSNKFIKNTGWLIADKVFHMVLSLVITSITARYLGTHGYGLINYGLAFVNVFIIVCKLGIDAILVNEIIRDSEKTGEILGTTLGLRLVSGILSVFATALFVLILKPGNWVIFAITCIQALSVVFAAFDTMEYYFQSQLASQYSTISRTISYSFVCVLRILLVICHADVVWFAFAAVLDYFVVGTVMLLFYRKVGKDRLCFSKSRAISLLTKSRAFILSGLLVVIYTQMDRLMIGSLANDSETQVGLYTAAMNLATYWIFVPTALMDSARPIIMTHKAEHQEERYIRRYKQLICAIIWISILAGIAFTLFPKWFIYILYGKAYQKAIPLLVVLIWSKLFSLLGTVRGIWLVCEDYSRYVKYLIGGGAIINLVLNFILIPQMGAMGAAIATLITEICGAIFIPLLFKDTRPFVKLMITSIFIGGERQ